MRLGIMAFASDAGLGNQTRAYYKHLKPDAVLAVDISSLDKKPIHKEWYRGKVHWTHGIPTNKDCEWLVDNSDVILVAETPLNYHLFSYAKKKGVKTILQYNYEFLDYLQRPELPLPDVLAAPSIWNIDEIYQKFQNKTRVIYLKFPLDREHLPFRRIDKIRTFIHVAGHQLFEDRNGTNLVLEAIPYIKNKDIHLIVYSQHRLGATLDDPRVEIRETSLPNYYDLYKEGDSLLLPRRFGGQSLQLDEAMSTGMIPIMLNCSPNDSILDSHCLVETSGSKKVMTRSLIDCYDAEPELIAAKIDEFASLDKRTVSNLNKESNEYATWVSWEHLKGRYRQLFEELA